MKLFDILLPVAFMGAFVDKFLSGCVHLIPVSSKTQRSNLICTSVGKSLVKNTARKNL